MVVSTISCRFIGDRCFAVAGPRTWNRLPIELRQPDLSLEQFRRLLKGVFIATQLNWTQLNSIELNWPSWTAYSQVSRVFVYDVTIPRWRTAAILKIVISPYLSEKSSDIDEILYTAADFELDERHVIKNEKVALDRLRVRQNVFQVVVIIFIFIFMP